MLLRTRQYFCERLLNVTKTNVIVCRSFGTSTKPIFKDIDDTTRRGGGGVSNDDYFATVHHISNVVRRDIYMERTLNKMCISRIVNSELVYRVLRNCCHSGSILLSHPPNTKFLEN